MVSCIGCGKAISTTKRGGAEGNLVTARVCRSQRNAGPVRALLLTAALAALPFMPAPAMAGLGFTIGGSWDTPGRKAAATTAMQNVVNRYNSYGDFGGYNIYVYYDSGIPTAQSNYLGSIGFGGTYPNDRVAQHESNHYLGSGTTSNWTNRFSNSVWTGPKMNALDAQFDGDGTAIKQAGVHFYGYGLNYDSEVVNSSVLMRNIALMYAQRQDDGLGNQADPWSATAVTLNQSDAVGTSAFNWFGGWTDGYFAHPNAAYSTANFTMRTPLDTYNPGGTTPSFTFAGDSLAINNTNGINGGLVFQGIGTSSVLTFKNLILNGGYVRHASGAGDLFQIAGHVTLASTATIDAAQGNINIAASISGAGSMTKVGAYTLTLTGSNSYTGQTIINSGTLAIDGQRALGGALYGGMTFNGGTLQYIANLPGTNGTGDISQNAVGVAKPVTINGGGANIDTNGNNVTYAAGIGNGGVGALTKSGVGTLTLAGANNYGGATNINGGVLRLGQLVATAAANYSFDNVSGSTVVNDGTGGTAMNGTLTNGATIVAGGQSGNAVSLANGASVNINSPITDLSNTANWTVSAWVKTTTAGSSILTKDNTGADWGNGNTILYLGNGNAGGSGGIPSGVRYGGGFLQANPGSTPVNDGTWHQVTYVNNGGTYAVYRDGVAQSLSTGNSGFSNADIGSMVRLGVSADSLAGDGAVNFNGLLDSVQVYGSALSSAQITSLYQGSGGYGSLPSTTNVTIAKNATLDLNGAVQQIGSLSGVGGSAVTLGSGQLTVNSSANTQFAGTISGSGGSLVKQGTGTLTFTGANTYTGTTTISGGVLRLDKISSAAVANYSFDNIVGSTVVNGGTGGTAMNGTLTNGATIVAGGQSGNAVRLANGASVNINSPITDLSNTANWTVSAWVKTTTAGSSILTKDNTGTDWGNGNTIFYLGNGNAGGSGGIPSGVRYAGGFLQAIPGSTPVNDGTWHQVTYVNNAGAYAVYRDGVAQSLSTGNSGFSNADIGSIVRLGISADSVAGDGAVNFNGLLDNVQIYNQALTAGQIAALSQGLGGGSLPVTTDVSIASGATLDINGMAQQIASLSGPAGSAVTLGSGTLTLNTSGNATFSGVISGTGSVLMSGSGIQTLGGNDTYTGTTSVTNGILNLGANQNTTGILVRNSSGITIKGGKLILGSATSQTNRDVIAVGGSGLSISGSPNAWTGTLDLGTNDLVLVGAGATGLATITNQIRSGYAAGAWNGPGISSSAAAGGTPGLTALGVILNNNIYGTAAGSLGTFDTINPGVNDVLVKYTYYGDANLDGKVDGSDYTLIDNGFNNHLTGWLNGDFNYDNVIDGSDYTLIDNAFNTQGASIAAEIAGGNATIATQIATSSAVPEPTFLAPLLVVATALLSRRRLMQRNPFRPDLIS